MMRHAFCDFQKLNLPIIKPEKQMYYICFSELTDADRFQKHGMDEFISANPCKLDHAFLFRLLQRQTLDHRLNDSYSCLVSKSLSVYPPIDYN